MSVTIDITGLPHERIRILPSPLAELGMALHALNEPAHHPQLTAWTTTTATALDPHLADRLDEAHFLWGTAYSDIFMPFAGLPAAEDARPGATLAEDLDLLDRISDEDFVAAALEFTCDPSYGLPALSPLADAKGRAWVLQQAAARGPKQVHFTERTLSDPPAIRAWFRRLMEDCEEAFFADTWQRVGHELAADARHKGELLRHKGLPVALREASPAISLDEAGDRITVDKLVSGRTTAVARQRLTLVPTRLGSPHLMVLHRYGWQPVVHYPLPGPQLTVRPSVAELTLRMEALAHPVRMRLCRMLSRGACSTSELAEANGLTAPEVSRHLAVLKKAGLVTTRRRGRYLLHQLDLTVVSRVGTDFIESILR